MTEVFTVFYLLIAFQIKHFFIDFFVQLNTKNHLNKFSNNTRKAVNQLAIHGMHHGICTGLIAVCFGVSLQFSLILALADMFLHALIDGVKASPYLSTRYSFPNKQYFYALGLDQAAHHFTHYAIIFVICILTLGV